MGCATALAAVANENAATLGSMADRAAGAVTGGLSSFSFDFFV